MSLSHVPPHAPTPSEHNDHSASTARVETPTWDIQRHPFQTQCNKLGIFRHYTCNLTWQPKDEEMLPLLSDSPSIDVPTHPVAAIHEMSYTTPEPFAPFTKFSCAVFMATYFSGSDIKSAEHANQLADAMHDQQFSRDKLKGFNVARENA